MLLGSINTCITWVYRLCPEAPAYLPSMPSYHHHHITLSGVTHLRAVKEAIRARGWWGQSLGWGVDWGYGRSYGYTCGSGFYSGFNLTPRSPNFDHSLQLLPKQAHAGGAGCVG